MVRNCGERLMLGAILLRQGEVTRLDLAVAISEQIENGKRLGQILLDLRAVSGGVLDRALAVQSGMEPELEGGFGTGLREALDRRHQMRRAYA
jgi:hypothetical protein